MKIRIDALDTLTFGVGKPSVWGEDTFGAGMFPPFPSVIRGAARSAWLYENGSIEIADTEQDVTRAYAITEYALLLDEKPHFPVPADHVWDEEQKTLICCELQPNDKLSSLTTPCQLWADADGKVMAAENQYLSLEELQNYLNGKPVTKSVLLSDYICDESKIGIYKERGRGTVKPGMLYRSPLIRPQTDISGNKTAIVANITGMNNAGLIRFGGENKTANFVPYDGNIAPTGAINKNGMFRLYLATPAIFTDGYAPQLPGATLLTAAIYGYTSAGGFDMKNKRPKPMRRAVRAGSVYYYQLDQNTSDETRAAILKLHGTSISDFSREDGFGLSYIGKTKED